MGDQIGNLYKLLIGIAGGTSGTTEFDSARDVNFNMGGTKVDNTKRRSKGWRTNRQGLKEAAITFDFIKENTDATQATLKNFFLTGAAFGVSVVDDENNGAHMAVVCTQYDESEPQDDVVTVAVTLDIASTPTFD